MATKTLILMIFFQKIVGEGTAQEYFRSIQPKAIRSLLITARSTLDLLLMQASDYAVTASNDGRKQLSQAGLPASLETYKSGGEIPETLWGSILRVQNMGGINELNERYNDLESSAARASLSMDNINASIMREERIDNSFRTRFPSSVMGTPSTQLNTDIKVKRFNDYFSFFL